MGKCTGTASDFPVDTNGQCFVCLSKVLPEYKTNKSGSSSVSTQPYLSLHSLSQYLKMDMSKVFHEKESIPSELLDSVQNSRLKVSLCEQCAGWNDRITSLCRKLEKIETEVSFYLGLIRGSLLGSSEEDNKTGLLSKLGDDHGALEKVRIVKTLRTEATEKCSHKLGGIRPRVKVQNLTSSQVFSIEKRIQSKSRKNESPTEPDLQSVASFCDAGHIKNEEFGSDTNDNFDDNNDSLDGEYEEESNKPGDHPLRTESPAPSITQTQPVPVKRGRVVKNVSLPNNSIRSVEKLTFVINPETNKFKCSICYGEFTKRLNLRRHYDSVHLKIKHKCNLCGKEFTQMSDLKRHHKSAHVGVRFKCNLCGKCFTQKDNLFRHQRSAHIKK